MLNTLLAPALGASLHSCLPAPEGALQVDGVLISFHQKLYGYGGVSYQWGL